MPHATSRALLVEDNPGDVRLARELLSAARDRIELDHAVRLQDALARLNRDPVDVILLDLALPDAVELEALEAVRLLAPDTPIVVWTGHIDAPLSERIRGRGAHDVLAKHGVDATSLTTALLTAAGAATFEEAIDDAIRRARTRVTSVGILQAAVGGSARALEEGGVAWRAVRERIAAGLRAEDGLYTAPDGRFGIVAEGVETSDEAAALARELARVLERPVVADGQKLRLTLDVGWTLAGAAANTQTALARSAPHGEGDAGRTGPVAERRSFARRLRRAIAADQLVLHYQPLVRVNDDSIPIVEALVRWRDPARGLLSPAEFVPLAEELGLIEEIGAWALAEACGQLREWDDLGLPQVRVAVNLSARELCSAALPARVADALADSGLAPDRLELELTESMFADPDATVRMLDRLHTLGVRVAIDDFGSGYSSLGYLTRFAVDVVKVDGAFVRRAAADEDAGEVVRAIVAIAHQLGLEVVAEGVETLEQLRFVQSRGVDIVQGYLYCEPLAPDACGSWLAWAREQVALRAVTARDERHAAARRGAGRRAAGIVSRMLGAARADAPASAEPVPDRTPPLLVAAAWERPAQPDAPSEPVRREPVAGEPERALAEAPTAAV